MKGGFGQTRMLPVIFSHYEGKEIFADYIKFFGQFWPTRGPLHLSRVLRGPRDLASEDRGQLPVRPAIHQIYPFLLLLFIYFLTAFSRAPSAHAALSGPDGVYSGAWLPEHVPSA